MRERMAAKRVLAAELATAVEPARTVVPEVQAVLDMMTPERRAKLEQVQAAGMARLAETLEGREALERLEARHNGNTEQTVTVVETVVTPTVEIKQPELPKPVIVREVPMRGPFRITGTGSGMCVSEMGACQCGEAKLKWHPICLTVKVNV